MSVLVATDLSKTYRVGEHAIYAVRNVSLDVQAGELVAIVGPSGSGKSTLLHLLGGLDRPDSGTVRLEDQSFDRLAANKLTILRRRRIGFVFQSFNLLSALTVEENVVLPLLLDGRRSPRGQVEEALAAVGLSDRRTHRPGQLSGGQQQRVAIARALITRPALVLADEPTGQLDSKTGEEIVQLLRGLCTTQKTATVVVTHDPKVIPYADRVLRMEDGSLAPDQPKQAGLPRRVERVDQGVSLR